MKNATLLTLALTISLSACGGGGSGAGNLPAPPPAPVQLPVPDLGSVAQGNSASALPAGWQHGAFMEIYVRGYKDSDGDGIGDLRGLISKLDYLQDLGIKGIWLMPVTHSSDADHGYAVQNYRAIEPAYGTMADFDELLVQAHARGIGIVIDYVINHSSSQHPLFRNAAAAPAGGQRDFYLWQATRPSDWNIYGANPWHASPAGNGFYFAGFHVTMPDFNLNNAAVLQFHHDNLRFWLNKGVDGMRFDAVGNLIENGPTAWEAQPGNHVVMAGVRSVFNGYSQRYLVCEAPAAPQAYAASTSCGGAFAFDLKDAIIDAARGRQAGIEFLNRYYLSASAGMAAFASNHDSFAGNRLWNQLNGDLAMYKLAAASYLLLPGTPFVYYGEEVGMASGAGGSGDHNLRTPMSWSADNFGFGTGTPFRPASANRSTQNAADQVGRVGSLHSFYKALLAVRASLPSIAQGSYSQASTSGQTMSYQRRLGNETTLVVFNYGTVAASVTVRALPANATLDSKFGGAAGTLTDGEGSATLIVAPQSVSVYLARP